MFAAKARAAGVEVELQVWDGMIHVFQMFGAEFAEAGQAIESIAKFVDKHLHIKAERAAQ
jgi:acetyl esterase/lipase